MIGGPLGASPGDPSLYGEAVAHATVPDGFLWGVATSAYQTEDRINGDGEPQNYWRDWERTGRIEPSGTACAFWDSPETLLDAAAAAGANCFRLALEWARIEPAPGETDENALARYAEIVSLARERGLEPVVTLQHFTHPRWAGLSPWVGGGSAWFLERFVNYVRLAVTGLCRRLAGAGEAPPALWITVNEPNLVAFNSWLAGTMPPGSRGMVAEATEAIDTMCRAHVLAYDAIHDAYEDEGWPEPTVTMNIYASSVYELDWMLVDVLTAAQRGMPRHRLSTDLAERRSVHLEMVDRLPRPTGRGQLLDRIARLASRRLFGRGLPRTLDAVYASRRGKSLDAIAFDWYDPFPEQGLRRPGRRGIGRREWSPAAALWEFPPNPVGLLWWLRLAAGYGLPVYVTENSMASDGAAPRTDGLRPPAFLQANITSVLRALDEHVPVAGYLHWTIADNDEWGSFRPRFGLHAIEDAGPDAPLRVSTRDSLGDDAAATYATIIEAVGSEDARARLVALGARH